MAEQRLNYLCEFFRNIRDIQKYSKKKRTADELTFDEKGQVRPLIPVKKPK